MNSGQLLKRKLQGVARILVLSIISLLMANISFAEEEFTAKTIGDYQNITVMEVTGNYDAQTADGSNNGDPRRAIAKEFYKTHDDKYDVLVIFTNFDFKMLPDAWAFYMGVKNDVEGIGEDIFDNSAWYGSNGKLQGTIDMGNIANMVSDPLDPEFEQHLGTLSHELMHRWGVHAKFIDDSGNESSALLGRKGCHWSFLLDTGGSNMYGNEWRDNKDGTFTTITPVITSGPSIIGRREIITYVDRELFSPLDLYLMGIYDKSQVPPMLLIKSPETDVTQLPAAGVTVNGTAQTVTIDDIIAAMGERKPSAADAQKEFKTAFIFATRPATFTENDLNNKHLFGIESLRKAWVTRLSILTDGRSIIEIDPTPDEILPTPPDVVEPVASPRTSPASIDEGVEWLKNKQTSDGGWQSLSRTAVRDTAEAILALRGFKNAQSNYDLGLKWLGTAKAANVDYLARQIIVRALAQQDVQTLATALAQRQNPDGGWGGANEYLSMPVDTALAIQSLHTARHADIAALLRAVDFLVTQQNADGGWGFGAVNKSRVYSTALVVQSLRSATSFSTNLTSALNRATAFLLAHQNADGGFGTSSLSTVSETALSCMALRKSAVDAAVFDKAEGYLQSKQWANGSWNDEPYSTALALQTLGATKPNLIMVKSSGISFTPSVLVVKESVVISAIVGNTGNKDAANVSVSFYDGDPASGGALIDRSVITAISDKGGTGIASVTWTPATSGVHNIFVVADAADTIPEIFETDNSAAVGIHIYEKSDLTVQEIVIFNPEFPAPGQAVDIQVKVTNLGELPAQNVAVRLSLDGVPLPDKAIATLNSLQSQSLTFTLSPPRRWST